MTMTSPNSTSSDYVFQDSLPGGYAEWPGLSKGHISPHQCNSLRIAGEFWADTPTVAQFGRMDGYAKDYLRIGAEAPTTVTAPQSVTAIEGRAGSAEWSPDGSFLRVRKPSLHAVRSALPSQSKRGSVSDFSRRSRCRLLQTCARMRRAVLPYFVTLTYPGKVGLVPWGDSRQWKTDLDKLFKRLYRRWPAASAIWKLEPQRRKAPHFHLLLWLEVPGLNADAVLSLLRAWVQRSWWECVGKGDADHFKAGTGVQKVESWRGVCHYAAKYMAKSREDDTDGDGWDYPGRWWGVFNRACLPVAAVLVATFYYNQACDLMRWLRRFRAAGSRAAGRRRLRGRDSPSAWAFVEDPDLWMRSFERYCADRGAL